MRSQLVAALAFIVACRGEATPPLATSAPAPEASAAAASAAPVPASASSAEGDEGPPIAASGAPVVDLDGKYNAPPPLPDGPPPSPGEV